MPTVPQDMQDPRLLLLVGPPAMEAPPLMAQASCAHEGGAFNSAYEGGCTRGTTCTCCHQGARRLSDRPGAGLCVHGITGTDSAAQADMHAQAGLYVCAHL